MVSATRDVCDEVCQHGGTGESTGFLFAKKKLTELGFYFNIATGDHCFGSNQENVVFWPERFCMLTYG